MFVKNFVIFLVICVFEINSYVLENKKCRRVRGVEEFDVSRYLGVWYGYEGEMATPVSCGSTTYFASDNRTVVLNKKIKNDGTLDSRMGFADILEGGTLNIDFPATELDDAFSVLIYILETDYHSYSTLYSCADINGRSVGTAWVLTREQIPSQEVIDAAEGAFKRHYIRPAEMTKVIQTGC